ncbi:MAG: nucleotidyltransferase family protein [Chloroflexota bacterium]
MTAQVPAEWKRQGIIESMVSQALFEKLRNLCRDVYGARLVSLAVFGSVGRGNARPDSDVDILLVVEGLSHWRMKRVEEFTPVETALGDVILSPVLKTPDEIKDGSPLLLDMVEDAVILYDRGDFLKDTLSSLRARLSHLGAKRIWRGDQWFWDLKPDYQRGEVFEV